MDCCESTRAPPDASPSAQGLAKRARLRRGGEDAAKFPRACGSSAVDDRRPDTAGGAVGSAGVPGVSGTTGAPAAAAAAPRPVDDCSAQPDAAGAYIKGTRLVIGGWFQACRGCNEPTARTSQIAGREVPFCPRCLSKYETMVSGHPPPGIEVDPSVEPLCYHLPKLLGAVPPLAPAARREFCDRLVLRQDDAWRGLIKTSAAAVASGTTAPREPAAAAAAQGSAAAPPQAGGSCA